MIGIVIPALDEAETLPRLLGDLSRFDLQTDMLVVDGGSSDDTVEAARRGGARILRSGLGRARQMNAGAVFLQTPWLLMLHADSRVDRPARTAIEQHVRANGRNAAYCGLRIGHPHFFYRLIEGGQRIRVRCAGLVYGDQGLLIPRDLFFALGAYPDEPVMEDVILNRRLLRAGRLHPLAADLVTSPRRYEEEGRMRGWIRNAALVARFLLGGSPAELVDRYPPRGLRDPPTLRERSRAGKTRAMVLVFAKAPRPGSVKTRLARSIGDAAAARVYRRMGRWVIDQLAGVQAEVTVCYDPPGARDEVRTWLGDGPAHYWAQPDGNLGRRMAHMCDRAFKVSDRVAVIGTDAPSVDAGTVNRALAALDTADIVLGPAADGGYYLIGLRAHRPPLFTGMSWSTDTVLRDTEARASESGARVTFLEVQSDIDTADDLTPELADRLGMVRPGRSTCRPAGGGGLNL